jgi:GAF domain-containing protein
MTDDEELEAATARILALETENTGLRSLLSDASFIQELRARLTHAAAAGTLSAPADHSELLRQTVSGAINVLHAAAGSLYVVDDVTDELVFQVALPEQAQHLIGQRLPPGHGLAGWVAATGQAIAVADVQQDPRWAADITSDDSYAPKTMIAAPLLLGDRVIGVIQILDKDGGTPFGAEDLAMLGEFANQAAIAIEQSQRLLSLGRLFRTALAPLLDGEPQSAFAAGADQFVSHLESSREHTETLQIAALLAEIARRDDAGRRLCIDLVSAIAKYLSLRAGSGL